MCKIQPSFALRISGPAFFAAALVFEPKVERALIKLRLPNGFDLVYFGKSAHNSPHCIQPTRARGSEIGQRARSTAAALSRSESQAECECEREQSAGFRSDWLASCDERELPIQYFGAQLSARSRLMGARVPGERPSGNNYAQVSAMKRRTIAKVSQHSREHVQRAELCIRALKQATRSAPGCRESPGSRAASPASFRPRCASRDNTTVGWQLA